MLGSTGTPLLMESSNSDVTDNLFLSELEILEQLYFLYLHKLYCFQGLTNLMRFTK